MFRSFIIAVVPSLMLCGCQTAEELEAKRLAQHRSDLSYVGKMCNDFGFATGSENFALCVQVQYNALIQARVQQCQNTIAAWEAVSEAGRAISTEQQVNSSLKSTRINTIGNAMS